MSDKMEISNETLVKIQIEKTSGGDCDMELETDSICSDNIGDTNGVGVKNLATDVPDSSQKTTENGQVKNFLKLELPNKEMSFHSQSDNQESIKIDNSESKIPCDADEALKLSPSVFNSEPFQQNITNDSPFQKPGVCRTHSVGSGDPSPYAIRRRPGKLAFPNQTRSPSAFKRKLKASSQLRFDDYMEDSDLKRCNSAPMLHEMNEIDARMPWHHASVTPGSVRARRFSATVLSSPSGASSKSTSRLNQLKKEESLEGIQYKETAHEREVQTSLLMNHTCEELSLSDGTLSQISGGGDGPHLQSPLSDHAMPRSPLPSINPVSVPYMSKSCPTRAIDFASSNPPPVHHSPGGSIPSPLTIPTGPLNLPSLPPSPTRSLPYVSTGKQCYSPSMQVPLPAQYLRPGSLSPSPSPTRRTFVTRRRSQSPCVLKPSALGSIKRKYDSDSEGGSSPKRMFIPATQHNHLTVHPTVGESYPTYPPPVTPIFTRNSIYRSHSLSSSSMDSVTDINVSPSPPQPGVNMGFLSHPLTISTQMRDGNSASPFQSPLHPFSNTVGAQELMRCSSPASSTCSSSSLEGLKDLPPFAQSQLATQSTTFHPLVKPQIKDFQVPDSSRNISSTNLTS